MDYFPLFLDIRDKHILVVGGGIVAFRKIKLILSAGGRPLVVAPDIINDISRLAKQGKCVLQQRKFIADDIKGVSLIFVAVNDKHLEQKINILSSQNNIPINVVDNQKLCSFITPAIVERDPLLVAISSSGKAPVAARRLREDLESRLTQDYSKLVQFMGNLRPLVKAKLSNTQARYFYEKLWDSNINEFLARGDEDRALEEAKLIMAGISPQGIVWLAGAGPGSVDELTLGTLRLMHNADIILHDRLVSAEILQMARRDATVISVAKPQNTQEEINCKMVYYVKQGLKVLRLKGGDPAIFSRLSEEIDFLRAHDVTFYVFSGITAAAACAAYAAIPLTDRNNSYGALFLSLRSKDINPLNSLKRPNKNSYRPKTAPRLTPDIEQLLMNNARRDISFVIYMGVENIALGVNQLLKGGMDINMPALVVEKGGICKQKIIHSCLQSLVQDIELNNVSSPATIIIGKITG